MEEQNEEDDQYRYQHSRYHLWHGFTILFCHTANLPIQIGTEREFRYFLFQLVGQLVGIITSQRFTDDGNGAYAIASDDAAIVPVGRNLSQLTERHTRCSAHHRDVFVGKVAVVLRLQYHLHRIIAFPEGGHRNAIAKMNSKIGREQRLVHTQTVGLGSIRRNPDARQRLLEIGADQIDTFYLMHAGGYLPGGCLQVADAVAAHSYFDRVAGIVVIHLLEADVAIREVVGVAVGISVEYLFGGTVIYCIHDELGKVGTANLRSVGGMETGRTLSDKRGYRRYLRVALQDVSHRICHLCSSIGCGSVRKIELHGKLVSLGNRHHSLRKIHEDDGTDAYQHHAQDEGDARTGETVLQQPGVTHLQIIERLLPGVGGRLTADALMNHPIL